MNRETLFTEKAPKAIGPYSQAVKMGNLLFISGQIPLDPATGEVTGGDIEQQTERVLNSIQAILENAGTSLEQVAKTTVFLADFAEFPRMNEVYARFFGESKPARATVEVSALPKGVKIEIDAIAVTG